MRSSATPPDAHALHIQLKRASETTHRCTLSVVQPDTSQTSGRTSLSTKLPKCAAWGFSTHHQTPNKFLCACVQTRADTCLGNLAACACLRLAPLVHDVSFASQALGSQLVPWEAMAGAAGANFHELCIEGDPVGVNQPPRESMHRISLCQACIQQGM